MMFVEMIANVNILLSPTIREKNTTLSKICVKLISGWMCKMLKLKMFRDLNNL